MKKFKDVINFDVAIDFSMQGCPKLDFFKDFLLNRIEH